MPDAFDGNCLRRIKHLGSRAETGKKRSKAGKSPLKLKEKRPAARLGLPARRHGAADVAFQGMGIDAGSLNSAAFAEGIFQDQLPVIFVAALDRQAQADMLAMGIPDLLALQAPAQR